MIVKNDSGILDALLSGQGVQTEIAWPGTNQVNYSGLTHAYLRSHNLGRLVLLVHSVAPIRCASDRRACLRPYPDAARSRLAEKPGLAFSSCRSRSLQ